MESWAHRFFDLSTQMLAVVDAEGRLLQVNAAWHEALGWTPAQLKAAGCWHFVHPEEQPALKARLRALAATDSRAELRWRWRCADGTWKRLGGSVMASSAEGRLYCTLTPLESSAPHSPLIVSGLSRLNDDLPFGLYVLETGTGRVLYANQRFRQMTGLEPLAAVLARGELTHAGVLERARLGPHALALDGIQVFSADAPPGTETEASERVLPTGRTLRRLTTPLRDPRGGSPCQLYVFEDVTDTKRTVATLHRTEASFRKLIERMPEGIFVYRPDQNQGLVYVNPTMCAALGHEHAEALLGQSVWRIVHPDSIARVRERMTNVLGGQENGLEEMRLLRRDGSAFDAECTSLPIEFDGQSAVAVVSRDLTERKRLQSRMLQTDRMAMVGTLAAGVGHEINNPLSYILTNIRLAQENTRRLFGDLSAQERADNLQETQEMLQEAHEGGLRVRDIVRDLKLFSRQTEDKKVEVDVCKPLEFSLKMAQGELRHRAQIVRRYEPVPHVFAEESRLGQVFLNLLMNAAQSIPEGEVAQNTITLWVRPSDSGGVAVDVGDTGCGIAPEVLGRIFEPFFTTKPVGMGTGLGLSICHGILTELGGELTVRSELGRGTTFTLHLPAMPPAAEGGIPVPLRPSYRALPAVRKGRMLVIDNEPAVARSLARLIGPMHQVMLVRTGGEGLARLTSQESFDVIFCDLMMPDSTGMDVYEQVRQARPELARRFIFMTGGSFTPRARSFLESMPERWLEKPFDEKRLQRLISEVLRVP